MLEKEKRGLRRGRTGVNTFALKRILSIENLDQVHEFGAVAYYLSAMDPILVDSFSNASKRSP